jgi:hypothetical protein
MVVFNFVFERNLPQRVRGGNLDTKLNANPSRMRPASTVC